jgi:pimeloyl-ACP methyl ester carboxylesterase
MPPMSSMAFLENSLKGVNLAMSKSIDFFPVQNGGIAYRRAGKGPTVFVFSGGPGLSCSYIEASLERYASRLEFVCFDQPGCGNSHFSNDTTLELTISATAEFVNTHSGNRPYGILAHSWGALLFAMCSKRLNLKPSVSVLMNPSPLDREGFDHVGNQLGQRVHPKSMERISELMADGSREAGRKLMSLALPAYTGRNSQLPEIEFDYDIKTFMSVSTDLGEI